MIYIGAIISMLIHVVIATASGYLAEIITKGSGIYLFTFYFAFALYIKEISWYDLVYKFKKNPEAVYKQLREAILDEKGENNEHKG